MSDNDGDMLLKARQLALAGAGFLLVVVLGLTVSGLVQMRPVLLLGAMLAAGPVTLLTIIARLLRPPHQRHQR